MCSVGPTIEEGGQPEAKCRPSDGNRPTISVQVLETPNQAAHAEERESKSDQHEADDLAAQQKAADAAKIAATAAEGQLIPTWAQVGFAFVGTLLLIVTVFFTVRTYSHSVTSSERQLRAYIDVRPGGVREADDAGDAIGFVIVRNVGQIPATQVRTRVEITIGPKCRADFDQPDADSSIGSLQPSATMTQGAEPTRWANLLVENDFFFVFGVVNYIDGFKQERVTKFCHRYRSANMRQSWFADTHSYEKHVSEEDARQHHAGNDST